MVGDATIVLISGGMWDYGHRNSGRRHGGRGGQRMEGGREHKRARARCDLMGARERCPYPGDDVDNTQESGREESGGPAQTIAEKKRGRWHRRRKESDADGSRVS